MVFMPHWPKASLSSPHDSLDKFLQLMDCFGNPHLKLPKVIHIAGTNGKGSSVSMLRAILNKAGQKTHNFTSPHLLQCNERINIAGQDISDDELFAVLEEIRLACESLNIEIGFFQAMCAAAFLVFSRHKADFVILETGLGGEKDPTNIVPNPILTLITTISYDHQNILGHDIKHIAYAKAGIIKPNSPCVISAQMDEVTNLLFQKCELMHAPCFAYEYDFKSEENGESYYYLSENRKFEYSLPHMPGYHQIINSSAVIAATDQISNLCSLNISNEQIQQGLATANRRGRMTKIIGSTNPHLPKDSIFWLDGAHNDSGARAISAWTKDHLNPPFIIILAMTKKRDIQSFVSHFKGLAKHIYTVPVKSEASSYPPDILAENINSLIPTTACDDLYESLHYISQNNEKNILVTGSLFLIADFYNLLKNNY